MRRIIMVLCVSVMVLLALPSLVPDASAIPITGSSIGRVKTLSGSLFAGVNLDDAMTFGFSFDPLPAKDRKGSTSLGLYKNVDGVFSVDIAGGVFSQVFDDRLPAKLTLKPSPSLDEYKLIGKEGDLRVVWLLKGKGLLVSDSLDQIPDLTQLTRARGVIRQKGPSGEILSKLKFKINRPSVGIKYGEPDTTPAPEPATMILLGSGFLVLFGFARRKLRKG